MVWLHVVKWTLQPWWNLLLSLIQVKSGSFVYDPFAGTGTSELLTSHACCANSLMGLTAQTCSAACWWPKLICLMLSVHVIAEVVCWVGEHQHQLAHQCLSCEHFSTHTYEIGMGGHSWLKMGGAFVIWGIYNLNGAVMAKWDIVLGDMLEKTLVFRESLWTPLRFTLISAHSSILIKVFFILRSSAMCTNYSAHQPCLLTGRHGSLIVHLRQSIVLILSSLCFY